MYKNGMKFNAAQVVETQENKKLVESYSLWYQNRDISLETWLIRNGLITKNRYSQAVH